MGKPVDSSHGQPRSARRVRDELALFERSLTETIQLIVSCWSGGAAFGARRGLPLGATFEDPKWPAWAGSMRSIVTTRPGPCRFLVRRTGRDQALLPCRT
jgi:hypothetical protein